MKFKLYFENGKFCFLRLPYLFAENFFCQPLTFAEKQQENDLNIQLPVLNIPIINPYRPDACHETTVPAVPSKTPIKSTVSVAVFTLTGLPR